MVEGLNPQEAIARLEKFQQMFEVRSKLLAVFATYISELIHGPSSPALPDMSPRHACVMESCAVLH